MSDVTQIVPESSKPKFHIPQGDFLNFLKYLSTSGITLSIAKTIIAPLERLKLTYQVFNKA